MRGEEVGVVGGKRGTGALTPAGVRPRGHSSGGITRWCGFNHRLIGWLASGWPGRLPSLGGPVVASMGSGVMKIMPHFNALSSCRLGEVRGIPLL